MFILYTGLWVGLTLPISLSIAFSLLKPIVIKDTTGVSMLVIAIIVGLVNTYLGVKVIEKYIQPRLEKRKENRHFS
ncbi:hypothetical protein [Bacillus sp. SM2101]|uniref:hypothetical protein n=1 Tax=Bacillus sp. SM2101 TaxID=2805366 RepID=UPI001BDEEBBD|nr:hypothetical protein [Bacillus sp. SM2101]